MIREQDIIDSIKYAKKVIGQDLRRSAVKSVLAILKSFYLENKKYVVLNAPTGSGKSMIGLLTAISVEYLSSFDTEETDNGSEKGRSYYLTSTKSLQEQMDNDISNFAICDRVGVLKGTSNYDCLYGNKIMSLNGKLTDYERQTYKDAWCQGLSKEERFTSQFSDCSLICPYENQRYETSQKNCSVLNYHYFLTCNRSDYNPFFHKRELTICDEAHLLPGIVEDFCSMDFNINLTNKIKNFMSLFGNSANDENYEKSIILIPVVEDYFKTTLNYNNFKDFVDTYESFLSYSLNFIKSKIKINQSDNTIKKLIISIKSNLDITQNIINVVSTNIKNIYIESSTNESSYYKHTIKNLKETELIINNFIKKTDKILFMSATLGNLNEFSEICGLEDSLTNKFSLKSSWTFKNSPIYLTESGYLNYSNFDKNIDKVINDTLIICNLYHTNDKGIIHTATFNINEKLKNTIYSLPEKYDNFKKRFLFYQNSLEKEQCIDMIKNEDYPYIICGPSLCEGIDLNDDNGRFNILIKVPYPQINAMSKRKMDVSPLWYKRATTEKIIQSIGRTNRNKDDYSCVYLMDKCFDKLVYDMDDFITKRIEYIRI